MKRRRPGPAKGKTTKSEITEASTSQESVDIVATDIESSSDSKPDERSVAYIQNDEERQKASKEMLQSLLKEVKELEKDLKPLNGEVSLVINYKPTPDAEDIKIEYHSQVDDKENSEKGGMQNSATAGVQTPWNP